MDSDYYKAILVGQYNVGKSALINRLLKNEFLDEYALTVGVEYVQKEINVKGEPVRLQVWDSVGPPHPGWPREVPIVSEDILPRSLRGLLGLQHRRQVHFSRTRLLVEGRERKSSRGRHHHSDRKQKRLEETSRL